VEQIFPSREKNVSSSMGQDLDSISPTFYAQLLRGQIPKRQKDTDDLTVFYGAFGIYASKSCE